MNETSEELKNIKAIAFDFGGTLDIPGIHWFDYLWLKFGNVYLSKLGVTKEQYYDAYVSAERFLEKNGIDPKADLEVTLIAKTYLQMDYLRKKKIIKMPRLDAFDYCVKFVVKILKEIIENLRNSRNILKKLSDRGIDVYIVSNYYGNLETILKKPNMLKYITKVFDSTVVGIRKPNRKLWRTALKCSGYKAKEFLVIGDSMKNDILPAQSLGCPTILINQHEPQEAYTGIRITELKELTQLLKKRNSTKKKRVY